MSLNIKKSQARKRLKILQNDKSRTKYVRRINIKQKTFKRVGRYWFRYCIISKPQKKNSKNIGFYKFINS